MSYECVCSVRLAVRRRLYLYAQIIVVADKVCEKMKNAQVGVVVEVQRLAYDYNITVVNDYAIVDQREN